MIRLLGIQIIFNLEEMIFLKSQPFFPWFHSDKKSIDGILYSYTSITTSNLLAQLFIFILVHKSKKKKKNLILVKKI